MASASERENRKQDFGRDELDSELNAFVRKVHTAIDGARSKMSEERRQEADRRADAILEKSSASSKSSRQSA